MDGPLIPLVLYVLMVVLFKDWDNIGELNLVVFFFIGLIKNRSLIGYVPQDDVMNPLLTVKENIMHSAMMRLPSNEDFSKQEKERLVSVVINALGLNAKQDVIVGDLGN